MDDKSKIRLQKKEQVGNSNSEYSYQEDSGLKLFPSQNTTPIVNNSPQGIVQRKQQEIINNSPIAKNNYQNTINNSPLVTSQRKRQEEINNSPQVKKGAQLQFMVDRSPYMVAQRKTEETVQENYEYYIYKTTDTNVFQVWKRFSDAGRLKLTWDEFKELNKEKDLEKVKAGDKLKFPTGVLAVTDQITLGGNAKGTKTIRVAWTIDDGPQKYTPEMINKLGTLKAVTWYIQRNKLTTEASWKKLNEIQKSGGEIAIHSFHPTSDHSTWFPISKGSPAYSFPYAGKTEDEIMKDLESFSQNLSSKGIKAKFVRMPGGLISEVQTYAAELGLKKDIAAKIIKGEDISSYGEKGKIIEKDFKTLQKKLSDLDLLHWGGTSNPMMFHSTTWNAESSGVGARTDDVTKHISKARAAKNEIGGKFEDMAKKMKEGETTSLVILAHDSSKEDVDEVQMDIKTMEEYASNNNIKIEYCTMSQLFNLTTGKDVNKIDVKY